MEVGWKGPPMGWVKINTDGPCKDGSIVGCGGLIRGSEGEWLAGSPNFWGSVVLVLQSYEEFWKVSGVRNVWGSLQ